MAQQMKQMRALSHVLSPTTLCCISIMWCAMTTDLPDNIRDVPYLGRMPKQFTGDMASFRSLVILGVG